MADATGINPTGRFTGLAELYAQCRPSYPIAALDFIMIRCGLGPGSVLVDVGCGTGISSRLFAQRGLRVLGIEPNDDMRRQAQAEPWPLDLPAPVFRPGCAEATGLPEAAADAVLAAQAFHWFEPDQALDEFYRILKPGGWVVLLWNQRDESDPFTAAYSAVMGGPMRASGEALLNSPLFQDGEHVSFPHAQSLDEEALLGRAFSTSHAPREAATAAVFREALRTVFVRFQHEGQVVLRYQTVVYLARRRSPSL